jgi:hypothetical protein
MKLSPEAYNRIDEGWYALAISVLGIPSTDKNTRVYPTVEECLAYIAGNRTLQSLYYTASNGSGSCDNGGCIHTFTATVENVAHSKKTQVTLDI